MITRIVLGIATAAFSGAAALAGPAPDDRASEAAAERWGDDVAKVEPLKDARTDRVLKGLRLHRVLVRNPRAAVAGPDFFRHALALGGPKPVYVTTDADAAALIASRKPVVTEETSTLDLVLVFARLRDYEQLTAPPPLAPGERPEDRGPTRPEDWKTVTEKTEAGHEVECTLLTDPVITLCSRYRFIMPADGGFTVKRLRTVLMTNAYD